MWDIFISYAWEDKDAVAKPLAEALTASGLRVWFDEYELRLGDSLREKIDEGLQESRYGVVVLSHAFFQKRWSQRELDGLLATEQKAKRILPVWYRLTAAEVREYSPTLAGRVGTSTDKGVKRVAEEILKVVHDSAGARTPDGPHPGEELFQFWVGLARASNNRGYWLSVVAKFPGEAATFESPEKRTLVDAVATNFDFPAGDLDISSDREQIEIAYPRQPADKDFIARFSKLGVAAIQQVGLEDAIPAHWALSETYRALRCLRDPRTRAVFPNSSDLDLTICLSNWPANGVEPGDLLPPSVRYYPGNLRGKSLCEPFPVTADVDPLEIVARFAFAVSGEAGWWDYEEPLKRLTESKEDFRQYLEQE